MRGGHAASALLLASLGCKHGNRSTDPGRAAGASSPSDTASSVTSSDDATDTTDTGPLPALPSDPRPPSVILQGIPIAPPPGAAFGQEFGSYLLFAGDLEGDGAGDLLVSSTGRPKLMQVFDGPFARGTHEAASLAVGEYPGYIGNWSRAGDMNHDGRDDVWMGNWLFHGPLHGAFDESRADAEFVDVISGKSLSNFDADGDGELDVAWVGERQNAWLYYGPFEGVVPGVGHPDYDQEKQAATYFQGSCLTWYTQAAVAHDLPEPGHVAFLLGSDLWDYCERSYHLFDATGPRGRVLEADDSFAMFDMDPLEGVGDYDGDGHTDLWWGPILAGPFSGWIDPFDQRLQRAISRVLGDMTGDGVVDFLFLEYDRPNDLKRYYVVPGGAVGEGLDPLALGGIHIGTVGDDFAINRDKTVSGDLDGDGRADLVIGHGYSNNHGGEVRIWYASDLFP